MEKIGKVFLKFNGKKLAVRLNDSATARDFVSMLPMTIEFKDYKNAEKIAYPGRKLSMEGAPAGSEPAVGDVTYYDPWGNFAIFYKKHGFAEGLVVLGSIEADLGMLVDADGVFSVTIETAD